MTFVLHLICHESLCYPPDKKEPTQTKTAKYTIMQIPLPIFLLTILLALFSSEMASLLLRRAGAGGSTATVVLNNAFRFTPPTIKRFLPSVFNPPHTNNLRPFSSTPITTANANANMSSSFLDTVKSRRTIYQLSKSSPIPDSKIQEIIKDAVLHVPSSFNSQSSRVVLLVKEEHDKLWEIAKSVLKGVVPAEGWAATEGKLNGFKAAYGTVCLPFPPRSNPHIHFQLQNTSRMLTRLSNRSSSSPPAPPSPACKTDSPPTPTNSPSGPRNPTPCTNSPSGPPWKPKGSAQTYSTITR